MAQRKRLFHDGRLFPATDESVLELVQTYAGRENDHQRQMFEHSLRAALNLQEMQDLVTTLGFSPSTVKATSDRHWTWATRTGTGR